MLTKEQIKEEITRTFYITDIKHKDYAIDMLTNVVETVASKYNDGFIADINGALQAELLNNMLCSAQIMSEYTENNSFRKYLNNDVFNSTYK